MKITDDELTAMLNSMELEEPSMSFTRNVMEKVELEIKPVALKTKVDQRIINSIAAIFVLAILAVVAYAIANSKFTYTMTQVHLKLNVDKDYFSAFIKVFLGIDLIIALLYFDRLLRRSMT
jgi:hypothetical protein